MDDLTRKFELLRIADAADRRELLTRSLAVLSSAAALWYATGSLLMPAWGIGYIAANALYVDFLKRTDLPISRRRYLGALACSALVAALFSVMVIYIAFLDEGRLIFLAMCGVAGMALHALSRNTEWSMAGVIDAGAAMVAGLGVTVAAILYDPDPVVKVTIIVGALSTTAYFIVSFLEITDVRRRYTEAITVESQGEKMRVLGRLTSGIAHDFNNILTVMRGNLDLIEAVDDPARQEEFLAEVSASTDRATVLVQQLLAYARKTQLRAEDIPLHTVLRERVPVWRRMVPAHVSITVHEPLAERTVRADRVHLDSAVLNAVINASDALGEAGGVIGLSLKDGKPGFVDLLIEDDGPGMTDQVLEAATEPFFTTKGVGQGSGLGLSMIKGFMEQSGGRLTIENRQTGGLRLILCLPRAR